MTVYNTIKSIGKKAKYVALGGLVTLVIGCAPAKQAEIEALLPTEETVKVIQEAPEISRINAYFGPRVGGIWAHGEPSDGTNYTKGSLTTGFEAEFTGRSGLGARLALDSFKSEADYTVGGTGINVKNDSLVVGADIIYTPNRTSPVRPYAGIGICVLSENIDETVGAPFNERNAYSGNTVGGRGIVGIKLISGRGWSARVEAGLTSYPQSENVKTTSNLTAGIGFDF